MTVTHLSSDRDSIRYDKSSVVIMNRSWGCDCVLRLMNSLVNSDKNPNKHSPANRLIALCRQTIKLRHVPKVQERRKQPSRAFKRVRVCTHTCSWWLSIIDVMNRSLFSFSKIGVWDVNFEVCVCDVCSIAASRSPASPQFNFTTKTHPKGEILSIDKKKD